MVNSLLALVLLCAGCGGYHAVTARCQALETQARSLAATGDNKKAITIASQGTQICGDSHSRQNWQFRLLKADALTSLARYDDALQTLSPQPPDGDEFADIRAYRLTSEAEIFTDKEDYSKALKLLDEAESEAHQAGNLSAARLDDIAFERIIVYGDQADFPALLNAADRLRRTHPKDARTLDVEVNQAWGLMQMARFEEAAKLFEQARPEYEKRDQTSRGRLYNNLGLCYYRLGDLPRADAALQQAETPLRESKRVKELRDCLNMRGLVALGREKKADSMAFLREALDFANDDRAKAEVQSNMALASIAAEKWDDADDYNNQAFEIKKRTHYPDAELYSLNNQARIEAGRGNFKAALATLDSMTGKSYVNPALRIDREAEYVSFYRRLKDQTHAKKHYEVALALMGQSRASLRETANKLAYFDSQIALYDEWVRLLVGGNQIEEALDAAENSRSQMLEDRLGKKTLRESLTGKRYKQIARDRDAVLVTYWLAPEESYVWVITPEKIDLRKLPGEAGIAPLVEEYRRILEDKADPWHSGGVGERLRRAIFDPIESSLGSAANVILVPDGSLHAVNFEALPVGNRYWIERVALTIAPSLRVLAVPPAKRREPAKSRALIVGNAEASPDFPALENAPAEIAAVAHAFPGRSDVLSGRNANPSAYLAKPLTEEYIHFASHAAANAEQPLESAVILSRGITGDRLTARDLLQKSIHANLVTISACRSAGVRSYHGEGLVGLAWVFLQTGARGVIAGLWNVADSESTSGLMQDLYGGISSGMPPAKALREAKLKLLHSGDRFRLPYYWAPFEYYAGAGAP